VPIGAQLRASIAERIAQGAVAEAARLLGRALGQAPTGADAAFVCAQFDTLASRLPLVRTRLYLLRSFTVEPIVPFLRARAYAAGIDATVRVGGFNTYAQELLDPTSALYVEAPDVVVLAVRAADIAPELWNRFAQQSPSAVDAAVDRVLHSYADWVAAFRSRSSALLLLHGLEQPVVPAAGILDAQRPGGQRDAIEQVNRGLREEAARHRGVYLLDVDALAARLGRARWHDERRWHTMRLPLTAAAVDLLAQEYVRCLHPITGRTAKVLALDLDNTLWAGVVGEDGREGLRMGSEYPGASYRAVQQAALDLSRRGIMLAVCSRNNPDEALDVIHRHPDMLLRPDDFAVIRVGWEDKDEALRAIARHLNVGLDAVAFFDDNPRERELVRSRVPDVYVIDVPDEPADYAAALRGCAQFERLTLSAEDRQRTRLVDDERRRTGLKERVTSLEDYYRSLGTVVEIGRADAATISRVAQLTQKTNQFNLTTRRYTEAEIAGLAATPGARVLWMRVRDRFGDSGIVGVAIVRIAQTVADVDTLLLSCRVIGRTVETALLAAVAAEARAAGATRLTGAFVPTSRNAPARDFYSAHGFTLEGTTGDGARWTRELSEAIPLPAWITCEPAAADRHHAPSHP
jgi:FkbH-like protein